MAETALIVPDFLYDFNTSSYLPPFGLQELLPVSVEPEIA